MVLQMVHTLLHMAYNQMNNTHNKHLMTTKIITSYVAILALAIAVMGVITAEASEVTGTLSSDTSTSNSDSNGNITGTVTGNTSGGGGGSLTGGSNTLDDAPAGAVLGATDSTTTQTPGFPNAGTAPQTSSDDQSLWSTIMNWLKIVLPF